MLLFAKIPGSEVRNSWKWGKKLGVFVLIVKDNLHYSSRYFLNEIVVVFVFGFQTFL